MKKKIFLLCILWVNQFLVFSQAFLGAYSVSNTKKVEFAHGNLQYKASTNEWRFAHNQYDFVGNHRFSNVWENGERCSNDYIDAQYDGWIDLFGFGANGKKTPGYQSIDIPEKYGPAAGNLKGESDWGYQKIEVMGSDGSITMSMPNEWRTLTIEEWKYLLARKIEHNTQPCWLYAHVEINELTQDSVNALLLFPDKFVNSTDIVIFNQSQHIFLSKEQFNQLEAIGCVLLPLAGIRMERTSLSVSEEGCYWSATSVNQKYAFYIEIANSRHVTPKQNYKEMGCSVRLVRDI